MKSITSCWRQFLLAIALCISNSAQATTVFLDATNSNNTVVLNVAPGIYDIKYVSGAWTPWANVIGCNANGTFCENGWVNSFFVKATGIEGWVSDGMRYETAAKAEAAGVAGIWFGLGISTAGTLAFSLPDGYYGDNSGSITLSVTAVPEPESYGMLIIGLGLVGAIARHRKQA